MILTLPGEEARVRQAKRFCTAFLGEGSRPRYLLGRNIYGQAIVRSASISGVIDDIASGDKFLGLPVVRADDVPRDALVLNAAGGRPLTAQSRLNELGLENLDYFAFFKFSGLQLTPVMFNEGFAEDFLNNTSQYALIYSLLRDSMSRDVFLRLVSFRIKYDLELMRGFKSREHEQYFERFLELGAVGESFVDVGGYDGATTLDFVRQCPKYREINVFEPEPQNYCRCVAALGHLPRVHCHQTGLGENHQTVGLTSYGSGSAISDDGSNRVSLVRLDDFLNDWPTFIKVDVEGAEASVLRGARQIIATYRPRLAVSVYHRAGDFWRIPQLVFEFSDAYDIYLRHYTESIYETVMFFLPKK